MRFTSVLLGACFCLGASAIAAPAPTPVRAEIDGLLSTLGSSGCEFQRNGSWYDADQAKAHLLKKLNYLESKSVIQRTEDFIELAASTSSASGKAYLVKCPGASAVESKSWMLSALKTLRSPAGAIK